MPELPEVETIVRELNSADIIGKKISLAEVLWPRTIASLTPTQFASKIKGQTITAIKRRAKFIHFILSDYSLIVHLRMTGKFLFHPTTHERVRLTLNDGRLLSYDDQRKFGKFYLTPNPEDVFGKLGIEPLSEDFTLKAFSSLLQKSRLQIKAFLLNQQFIVGVGNIYADEALWNAFVHPLRRACDLTPKETAALFHAIPQVLQKGIQHQGTTLGNLHANYFSINGNRGGNQYQLNVFRREKEPCPRCGTTIIKTKAASRGTHLCPKCQVEGL